MTSSRLRAGVLAIVASLLAGCSTERSDGAPCPPVVAYSPEFLARAADELDSLPPSSSIEQMLADYQVMRIKSCVSERLNVAKHYGATQPLTGNATGNKSR